MPRPLPLEKLQEYEEHKQEIKQLLAEGMAKSDVLELYDITMYQVMCAVDELKKDGLWKRRHTYVRKP